MLALSNSLPLRRLHILNIPQPCKIAPLAGARVQIWEPLETPDIQTSTPKKPTTTTKTLFGYFFQVGRIEDFLYQLEDSFLKTKKLRTARRQKTKMKRLQTVQQNQKPGSRLTGVSREAGVYWLWATKAITKGLRHTPLAKTVYISLLSTGRNKFCQHI